MRVIVTGAGGFIGGHLAAQLITEGHTVVAIDSKPYEDWHQMHATAVNFRVDLAEGFPTTVGRIDRIYHLAANMGGIGFIETNKLRCSFSTLIDMNVIEWARAHATDRVFYSSSACVYPAYRQDTPSVSALAEWMAWPADPEPGYGLQKLYTEELFRYLRTEFGVETRIGRYHNVYGPHGTWYGGREKAPAALCRKVATAVLTGTDSIEIWGDGEQTRSFMYIDDCIEGAMRLADSAVMVPMNIGSDEMVTVNELAHIVMEIAGAKHLKIKHVPGALGVRGRNSDNTLVREELDWAPTTSLATGMEMTYRWIYDQVKLALNG